MSATDKAKDKLQEAKGHLKEAAGKATDDCSRRSKVKVTELLATEASR